MPGSLVKRRRGHGRGQRAEVTDQRAEGRGQRTEGRGQRAESSTTLSFPHAFSGNPEDVMVPR